MHQPAVARHCICAESNAVLSNCPADSLLTCAVRQHGADMGRSRRTGQDGPLARGPWRQHRGRHGALPPIALWSRPSVWSDRAAGPGCRFHLDRQWPASEESACAQALLVMHPCALLGGPAEYIHGAHLGCQRGAVRDCKDASGSRRQSERPGRCQSRSAGASRRAPSEDEVPSTQLGLSAEGSLLGGRAKSSARAAVPRCNSFEAATVTKHC